MYQPTYEIEPDLAHEVVACGPDDPASQALAQRMRTWERRHLLSDSGYFVMSGLRNLDEAAARRFLLAASAMLGDVVPHNFKGELIRDVRYRGMTLEDTLTARYSDTRQGGNLHTDGMHRPGPIPFYFALFCVRQAAIGGAMILIHSADIMRALETQPDVVANLRLPVHFDTRDDSPGRPPTVLRPILEITGSVVRICYLRGYIDSGHRRPGVPPLIPAQLRALDALDTLLDRADLQTRMRLEPGQLIIVNNQTVIHGRTPFADTPGEENHRLLLRTWIAGPR